MTNVVRPSNPMDGQIASELNRLAKHYGGYTRDILETAALRLNELATQAIANGSEAQQLRAQLGRVHDTLARARNEARWIDKDASTEFKSVALASIVKICDDYARGRLPDEPPPSETAVGHVHTLYAIESAAWVEEVGCEECDFKVVGKKAPSVNGPASPSLPGQS